jgi:CPA2 family monovalent cation:H+ antiporter-2
MHEVGMLSQVTLLFGTAIAMAWLLRLLKAPSIIGFLLTGMLIGPSVFGLIDQHQVEQFAEIGLVLLLFNIGLELSPGPLFKAGGALLLATSIQIGITALLPALALYWFGALSPVAALLLGLGVALSSTAIVLKSLSDRNEVQSLLGNLCTGILLLQDVTVIVVLLLLPFIAPGQADEGAGDWGAAIEAAGGLALLVAIVLFTRKVLPFVLVQITRHGGAELTTLFAVTMAAGGAWLAGVMGWPLPLGACVAGLLLAEADLRHQLAAEITPFRDVFNALFFVSLGMLVDLDVVIRHAPALLLAIAGTLVLKSVITALAVRSAGWSMRIAVQTGFALCSVSEFAYVLAREAHGVGLLSDGVLQLLIPYAVGTMLIGAILIPLSGPLAARVFKSQEEDGGASGAHGPGGDYDLSSHVVIVGYGVNGENLVSVLRATGIGFCLVEMNRALARRATAVLTPTIVGDATRMSILRSAGIVSARALVVAINDPAATCRIVAQARHLCPELYILVRTTSVSHLDKLYQFGANVVVPADFEVSIKIFAHVLTEMRIPDNVIQAQIASVRAGGYGLLRGIPVDKQQNLQELLEVFRLTATQTHYLGEDCPLREKTIAETHMRRDTGATIIAVVREGKATTNPAPDLQLKFGDVLVLVGSHAQLDSARKMLTADASHHVAAEARLDG